MESSLVVLRSVALVGLSSLSCTSRGPGGPSEEGEGTGHALRRSRSTGTCVVLQDVFPQILHEGLLQCPCLREHGTGRRP